MHKMIPSYTLHDVLVVSAHVERCLLSTFRPASIGFLVLCPLHFSAYFRSVVLAPITKTSFSFVVSTHSLTKLIAASKHTVNEISIKAFVHVRQPTSIYIYIYGRCQHYVSALGCRDKRPLISYTFIAFILRASHTVERESGYSLLPEAKSMDMQISLLCACMAPVIN